MSANEWLDSAVMGTGSIERTQASTRARALRKPPLMTPTKHIEGPDARIVDLARAVTARIASRPLTAAMLAVGVGFIVGGALSFRAGRAALAAAGRQVLRELLKQVL
jgi:hypothetical protein